jgi:hypothetical protein
MRRALVSGALGAFVLLLVACNRTDPTYYVDGARPSPCSRTGARRCSTSTRRATRHLSSRSRRTRGRPREGVCGGSLSVHAALSETEGAGAREAAIIQGPIIQGPARSCST